MAPIKQLSIPKMELQAAVLGTRLARFVKSHQNILFKETVFWCDSTAVLAWIKSSDKLKVYVSNRVREIQENSSSDSWYHISGKNNPADHVSRGIDHNNVRRDNIGGTSQFMNNSGSTTSINNPISERNSSNTQQTKSKKSPVGQGDHYIGKCSKVLQMSPSEQNLEVKKNLLCYNCISPNHNAKDCPSKVLRRHCSRKHHSMLHDKNYSPNQKTNITQHELPLCESFADINSGTKSPSYTPVFPRRIRNQLPMIPIKLFGRKEHFECYALLDTRLIFGARCSPTTAIFVLQKTANDFSPNQAVKDLVYNSFYMDNFVHSFETIQKAKDNTALLKITLSKSGFNLTKFVSNERSAIQDLDDSKENNENFHRVLGVHWNKSADRLFHKNRQSLTTTVTAIRSGNCCR